VKSGVPDFGAMKAIHDDTSVVVVGGDIEAACRVLRRRVLAAGVLRGLRTRRENPKAVDRKRVKAIRAASHRKRFQKRRAEASARDTS
jgi:ribosomal protein S21